MEYIYNLFHLLPDMKNKYQWNYHEDDLEDVLSGLILHLDRCLYVYSSIGKYTALYDSCICS